jgi:hypothetical protein
MELEKGGARERIHQERSCWCLAVDVSFNIYGLEIAIKKYLRGLIIILYFKLPAITRCYNLDVVVCIPFINVFCTIARFKTALP